MIKIKTYLSEYELKPTIFPDGTSQVWKLNDEILQCEAIAVVWNFESEREVIDLLSLRKLLPDHQIDLHIPYLPYGRQDKEVHNELTFNLQVLADLLNSMNLESVTSVDAHNPDVTKKLIHEFVNIKPETLHNRLIEAVKPDVIVFPDAGAAQRYKTKLPKIICSKVRDQKTGAITGHDIYENAYVDLNPGTKLLIVDDICDGGATFISVAKMLHHQEKNLLVDLFVTHGIFSKGREHLLTNGINAVYTTNSLLKNKDGFEV